MNDLEVLAELGATLPVGGLSIALLVGLALLAVVLNHIQARLALVELALNEGLPPGHDHRRDIESQAGSIDPSEALDPGIHVFLSRNCHACQRLLEELDQTTLETEAAIVLRYIDRPRPLATDAAARQKASLLEHQNELAASVGADPLPYTIALGRHELVSRSVTPTLDLVAQTARDAGFAAVPADSGPGDSNTVQSGSRDSDS